MYYTYYIVIYNYIKYYYNIKKSVIINLIKNLLLSKI